MSNRLDRDLKIVTINGKRYRVIYYDDGERVEVETKTGWRTLNGYGKANRWKEARSAIAAAKK